MKLRRRGVLIAGFGAWMMLAQSPVSQEQIDQLRNLGKAFYENPATQAQAAEQFRRAMELSRNAPRDRVNYGLALLRTGKTQEGIAELQRAQQQDPSIPQTWFNLGIALKREADLDGALTELQGMAKLVPNDPVTHYQIGSILKAKGDAGGAIREFERARDLNPRLAAPHFQLYGLYRAATRTDDAAGELRVFQDLKKQQEGAAVPEDMEWSAYAEIYDPVTAEAHATPPPILYRATKIADGFSGAAALGSDVIAWSPEQAAIFRNGRERLNNTGIEGLRGVVAIAPGDFDNDGAPDLCVLTRSGAELYKNTNGKFRKVADLAKGNFRQALWIDYDHDYDLDLLLVGEPSRLLRNNGAAGFSDESARFPFATARGLEAIA